MELEAYNLSDEEKRWVRKLWTSTNGALYSLRYDLTPIEPGDERNVYDRVKAIDFILQFDEDARLAVDGPTAREATEGGEELLL